MKRIGILLVCFFFNFQLFSQNAYSSMRDSISAIEIVEEMAPGVNLWNTLDAHGNWVSGLGTETMWGNPRTSPEMIAAIAERGFKTLRIPVTWYNHMGPAPDYKIDVNWMDRVEEVANYAFTNNLYVIINIHHDDLKSEDKGSWLIPTYEKQDEVSKQLAKVWTQIATRFKDYSDYLIFETMNEPREVGGEKEWSGGTKEHREVINAYNLAAVNAIRETGGNNASRFIMIPQVGANPDPAMHDMVIPNNDEKIIVSIHNYSPFWFCLDDAGSANWGSSSDIASLQNELNRIGDHFAAKGQAVVMGEWGASDKDNYVERVNYYKVYTDACKKAGITPIAWIYSLNRKTLTWGQPLIEDAMLQAYNPNKIEVSDIILNIPRDTIYAGESLQLSATIFPDSATYKEIAWSSNNKKILTIDSNGLIKAKSRGSAVISAYTIGKRIDYKLVVKGTTTQTSFLIEAEDFESQFGIQAENCSDENGGKNIGYIENGDWCSYEIGIDSAGIYIFTARAATDTNGGQIEISIKNNVLGTAKVDGSKTNGWQDWYTTEQVELELEKGFHDLKLTFKGSGSYLYNLNWFKIDYNRPFVNTSSDYLNNNNFDLQAYPNPFSGILNVCYKIRTQSNVDIKLLDISGNVIHTFEKNSNKLPGIYTETWNAEIFPQGVYFLNCIINDRTVTKKLILN